MRRRSRCYRHSDNSPWDRRHCCLSSSAAGSCILRRGRFGVGLGLQRSSMDGRRVVDVVRTQLDRTVDGRYRIRVYGRDFIKNETDVLRVYIDTRVGDSGPEYPFSWYLRSEPRATRATHIPEACQRLGLR